MNTELLKICDRFIENRDAFKKADIWQFNIMYPICAGVTLSKNRVFTIEEITESKKIIKRNSGAFSNFRGYAQLPLAAMLLGESDSERKFNDISEAYSVLKNHFFSSQNLVFAAIAMTEVSSSLRYDETAKRARHIFDLIRKNHPLVTNGEDIAFCVLMTLSQKSDEELAEETEKCFKILKNEFYSADSVQGLSLVLSLIDNMTAEEKCARVFDLYYALRERGIRYSRGSYLPTIGGLAALCDNISSTADDIAGVYNHLKSQKGYGFFGVSKMERAVHALMIVSSQRAEKIPGLDYSAAISTVLVVASQICALSAVAASSAASAAAAT